MDRRCAILILALALSGCQNITRQCPGFGTPLADKWSTASNIDDIATYVSNTGATVTLELVEREDSEPYVGTGRSGVPEVVCHSESTRRYRFENSEVALQIRLMQTHAEDPAMAFGESFVLRLIPEKPLGEPVGYSFLYFLGLEARQSYPAEFDPDGDTVEADPQAGRFIENLQIGDNSYPYAIEQKFEDLMPLREVVTDPNSFAGLQRAIVAENGGLVQFELLNGDVYSRL